MQLGKKRAARKPGLPQKINHGWALLAIVTDSLHGAAFHRLSAESNLLIGHRLLANEGKAFVIITSKEIRGGFAAKVAVDAVAVNIELTGYILLSLIVNIGHSRVCGVGNCVYL